MSQDKEIIEAERDYTPQQDEVIRNVYKHLAALLPELGRDYQVTISFTDKEHPNKAEVRMVGKTRIGQIFVEEAMNYFNQQEN